MRDKNEILRRFSRKWKSFLPTRNKLGLILILNRSSWLKAHPGTDISFYWRELAAERAGSPEKGSPSHFKFETKAKRPKEEFKFNFASFVVCLRSVTRWRGKGRDGEGKKRQIAKQTNWKGSPLKCRLSADEIKCNFKNWYWRSKGGERIWFRVVWKRVFDLVDFKGPEEKRKKKIKSPFHWLQLLMFNSNSICGARRRGIRKEWVAMIRNNNFPYFWLPPPGRLLANGLQIVVVIWLTICFLSVSGPPSDFLLLFFASMWCEIKEKQFSFQLYRLSRSKNTENCYLYSSFHSGFLSLRSHPAAAREAVKWSSGSRGCLRNYFCSSHR